MPLATARDMQTPDDHSNDPAPSAATSSVAAASVSGTADSVFSGDGHDADAALPLSSRALVGGAQKRILEKVDDYDAYGFNAEQSQILNIFFDLAQEFEDLRDLNALFVTIPKVFFGRDAALYLAQADGQLAFEISSSSSEAGSEAGGSQGDRPAVLPPLAAPSLEGNRFLAPIKGNRDLIAQLPFAPQNNVIGLLEISPAERLTSHDLLFFEKYANRIGFQLHNRLIGKKNKEHLAFIHNLVEDIGHNVIVPNMFFKLYYRRLESKIQVLKNINVDVKDYLGRLSDPCRMLNIPCDRMIRELDELYEGLRDQYQEIYRHYENTSLFLETLLRRSHFEQGRYVLEKRPFNFKTQVIAPQIERYRGRLQERGISVDYETSGVPDREMQVVADIGLISQVYANLFSNAVKYAREATDAQGRMRKFIAYGMDLLPNHFGPGQDGVKLNVFSTGPVIPSEEARRLFKEGFRGANAAGEYGSGHGLFFVKEVVELHGGQVGYEPTPLGNNFYFILPIENS